MAASDAVVEATVLDVGPGRMLDFGEGYVIEFEQATLRVDRILGGEVAGELILVEDSLRSLRSPWREGESGYFFLHLKDDPLQEPTYRPTSSQGRFDSPADFAATVEVAVRNVNG